MGDFIFAWAMTGLVAVILYTALWTDDDFNAAIFAVVLIAGPLFVAWVVCRYTIPYLVRHIYFDALKLLPARAKGVDVEPRSPRELGLYD